MERNFVMVALFAALIAALGLVPQIMLASGVPVTAQSLGIMLAGTALGARKGGLAVLLFCGLALAGLPLLSGGRTGLVALTSPTVGFFVGFPVAAFVTGLIVERVRGLPLALVASVAAVIGGIVVLYGFGVVGMAWKLGKTLPEATLLLVPYLLGDALKAGVAGMVTAAVYRARPAALLSRA